MGKLQQIRLGVKLKMRKELQQLDEKILGQKYFNNTKWVSDEVSNNISFMLDTDKRNITYDIVFNKFSDMYYIFAGANHNLSNASNRDLVLYDYETNDEDVLREFLRAEHLKSCILSYNSIEDYMMQIICFSYGIKLKGWDYKKQIITTKDFSHILSKEDFKDKCEFIKSNNVRDYINSNTDLADMKNLVNEYRKNSNIKQIRKYSNLIKHNCNFRFRETYYITNKCNENLYYVKPEILELEEIIDLCYKVNMEIKDYVNEFYNIIDKHLKLSEIN